MAKELIAPVVNLGKVGAVPLGQGRCFVVGSKALAVFRQRDGRIFVTQNQCPHGKGPLSEGMLGDGRVICPLHAHQFNLETGEGNGPAECLPVYGATEVDGAIMVTLEGTPS